eukprot:474000-Prymnesium_polylepis.1
MWSRLREAASRYSDIRSRPDPPSRARPEAERRGHTGVGRKVSTQSSGTISSRFATRETLVGRASAHST